MLEPGSGVEDDDTFAPAQPSRSRSLRTAATFSCVTLLPRYDGSPVITIPGAPRDQLAPVLRQRRRLAATLEAIEPERWTLPSRCAGWSIQDVVAHLTGVNRFWTASVRAGLAGAPSRVLASFDPVATPELLVAPTRELAPATVLRHFLESNDEFLATLEALDEPGWNALAEAPPGDLPIRLLASHALWDAWVHERDVLVPLREVQPSHPDEIASSLRYVCALTAAVSVLAGASGACTLLVEARDPMSSFALDLAEGVVIREDGRDPGRHPSLRGGAVDLIEALSMRAPFPEDLPEEWARTLRPFTTVFGTGP